MALQGPYSLGGVLAALFDLRDEPCERDRAPYGANMAFQEKMFEKNGLFRTDFGPSPDREIPRPNEGTEFGRRLISAGERLRYEPSAVAYHPVPHGRIKKGYFLSWWFDHGRAEIREIERRPDRWGIPRRYLTIAKIIVDVLVRRTLRWILAMNPQRRFFCKCYVWLTSGQVLEIHRQWRDVKGTKGQSNTRQGMKRGWNTRTP
jgi:hypothetical protein